MSLIDSYESGMRAVDEAAATITEADHKAALAAARTEGATAERTRLAGIEAAARTATAAATAAPAPVPQTADGWKAEWQASAKLQSEHASAEAYANWMEGVRTGRVRILAPGAGVIRHVGR